MRLRDNFFVPNFNDEKINKKKMSSSELNIANESGWTSLMFDVCTAQSSFDDSVSKSEFFSCQKPLFRDFFVVFENSRSQIFTISTISCQLERLGLSPGLILALDPDFEPVNTNSRTVETGNKKFGYLSQP